MDVYGNLVYGSPVKIESSAQFGHEFADFGVLRVGVSEKAVFRCGVGLLIEKLPSPLSGDMLEATIQHHRFRFIVAYIKNLCNPVGRDRDLLLRAALVQSDLLRIAFSYEERVFRSGTRNNRSEP